MWFKIGPQMQTMKQNWAQHPKTQQWCHFALPCSSCSSQGRSSAFQGFSFAEVFISLSPPYTPSSVFHFTLLFILLFGFLIIAATDHFINPLLIRNTCTTWCNSPAPQNRAASKMSKQNSFPLLSNLKTHLLGAGGKSRRETVFVG